MFTHFFYAKKKKNHIYKNILLLSTGFSAFFLSQWWFCRLNAEVLFSLVSHVEREWWAAVDVGGPGLGTDMVIPEWPFDLGVVSHGTPGKHAACLASTGAEAGFACATWSEGWVWFIVFLQLWQSSAGLPNRYPRPPQSCGLCTLISLFHFPPFYHPLPLLLSPPQHPPNYFFLHCPQFCYIHPKFANSDTTT